MYKIWVYCAVLVCLYAPNTQAVQDQKAPEPPWMECAATSPRKDSNKATPYRAQQAIAGKFMAVTANPHATKAAVEIMEAGGSAADAAIAAQLVLGLVEPQSSGIGGGGFALYWDADKKQLRSYDGREKAPSAINEKHFLQADGKPMGYWDAIIGGHAVGVPGIPALLSKLHGTHGKLPWERLFVPAITLAQKGFPVSERLLTLLKFVPKMRDHPHTRDYFFDNGKLPQVGHILRNPDYAKTLKQLQARGIRPFYRGKIAKRIVAAVRQDKMRAGTLSMKDMRDYRVVENQPLCASYRSYTLCGPPPPSSGGLGVMAILRILQHWDTSKFVANAPERIHLFAEASQRAFADRNVWVGDPNAMSIDPNIMLDANYLRKRSAEITLERSSTSVSSGDFHKHPPIKSIGNEPPSTSHLSIVDGFGNIISFTTTIEGAFGSRIMVGGFLLNNQLSDFSFRPQHSDGQVVVNRPGPNKKPRSSMSPMIAFHTQGMRPYLAIGSPGGARIINYVAQSMWLHMDAGIGLAESLQMGRIVHLDKGVLELEQNCYSPQTIAALSALGHTIKEKRHGSGIHAIAIHADGRLQGVADPRREGLAAGR